jgi:4-aminobutyrate aminotransferase-like enzyme
MTGMPLGYNNDYLRYDRMMGKSEKFLGSNVNAGSPPADFGEDLRNKVMPIAPEGLTQVCLTQGAATEANDAAIMNAVTSFAKKNNISDLSQVKMVGFNNGSHGNSLATFSVSSKGVNEQGATCFGWEKVGFPDIKYPMADNTRENRAEEDRVLANVR